MAIMGTSRVWLLSFIDVHDILAQAIQRVWPECRTACPPTSLENEMTRKLIVNLRKDVAIRSAPFFVESQLELLPAELKGDVSAKGYIDIAVLFFSRHRRKVYFAFECKRLNVVEENGRRRSLAAEYVTEGMMRFVTAQYAKALPIGGMLGYVMDGDVPNATRDIVAQIRRQRRRLRCSVRDTKTGTSPISLTTRHRRSAGHIRLTHMLISFR